MNYVFVIDTRALYVYNVTIRYEEGCTVPKVSEIVKKIKRNGCYKIREGREHEIWFSPATGEELQVPRHYAKELPTGTANSILRKAGLK